MNLLQNIGAYALALFPLWGIGAGIAYQITTTNVVELNGEKYGIRTLDDRTIVNLVSTNDCFGHTDVVDLGSDGRLDWKVHKICGPRVGCFSIELPLSTDDQKVYSGLLAKLGETK
jgi:hypothetical protein